MNPLIQSSLVGVVFVSAISISVALRTQKTRREILFFLLTISMAFYYSFAFLYFWQKGEFLMRILWALAILIPNAMLKFFREFISPGEKKRSKFAFFLAIMSIIVAAVTLPPLLPGRIASIVVVCFTGLMLYTSIYYLFRKSRTVESKVESTRILYLVIGGMIAVTFSYTDLLIFLNIPFLPLGSLIVSIYLFLLSQAIFSQRLMDLYELFGKMAVLGALALTIAGIFSVLTLFEMASSSFFVNAMAAAFVVLIIFDPLRERVEQKIGQFFLKEMSDFLNSVEEAKRKLGRAFELEEISSTLMEGLKKSGRFTNICFYIIGQHGEKFILKGFMGQKTPEELNVAAVRPLLDKITSSGVVVREILAEDLRQIREKHIHKEAQHDGNKSEALLNLLSLMDELRSDAIIPVIENEMVYGFIGVKDERMRQPFSQEDLKLLRSLSAHVAIAIENTSLYEKIKERDRLAAIGEMSAGLAHEIRNPLGAIKGAVQVITEDYEQNSKEKHDGAEKEFLDIIINEVDRLNRIVTSFLDYARPIHTKDEKGCADIRLVINQTRKIAESEISKANVDVMLDIAEEDGEMKAAITEERLGQVLWNLLINAIEATSGRTERGKVVISGRKVDFMPGWKSMYGLQPSGKFIEILVKDNGGGIPANVLPKIFIPFFTTKTKGTGLGLAISHRIVRDCGGVLEVETQEGKGTTFRVLLPAI